MSAPVSLLSVTACLGLVGLARAEGASPAEVPAAIKVPAGARLVLRAHAAGVQIYVCGQGTDGQPQWTLKAPEAELRDEQGVVIGHHSAGPSWKHKDGSEVTGKVVAKVDSPDAKSIPWLLLSATAHTGAGAFARVTSVQRVHTHGGKAPEAATCDPVTQKDREVRIPYSADYYFYAPAAQ